MDGGERRVRGDVRESTLQGLKGVSGEGLRCVVGVSVSVGEGQDTRSQDYRRK